MTAVNDAMNTLSAFNSFVCSLVKAMLMYSNKSSPKIRGINLEQPIPNDLPTAIEIKRSIPSHCFESSITKSMLYAIKDALQIIVAWLTLSYLLSQVQWLPLKIIFIGTYWAIQGTFFMGLFVMGHDCGHNSFSKYVLLNDIVGTISHSFLFVPYYQWKLTHKTHHKFTGNMDRDEVFYPRRKSQQNNLPLLPGFGYGLGWYLYLIIGYFPRRVRHYTPFSEAFRGHVFGCCCSLACILFFVSQWIIYIKKYGFLDLCVFYLVPLLVFGSFAVVITFLHHAEMNIPWYGDNKWHFVKGQLSTIDRNYGIIHYVIHCIGTHQMHHLFTKIPHYHLEEATQHFRQSYPGLTKSCDEPILVSFVRMFKKFASQSTVPDDASEVCYK